MSSGGGGGGNTTTVQKADPWVGVQPALSQLYQGALDQYKTGGAQYYPNSTLAGSNPTIDAALARGTAQASGPNAGISGLTDTASGSNLYSNPTFGTFRDFSQGLYAQPQGSTYSGSGNNGNSTYNQFASGDFNTLLSDTQSGKYVGQQNPYLAKMYESATNPMVDQFKNATAPGLASQFSMAGRLGSGSHAQAVQGAETSLGRGLADASASIYGNAYESERGRQQAAANSISGFQLQGAGGLSSNAQADAQRAQQASQFAQQMQQQQRTTQLGAAGGLAGLFGDERQRQQAAQMALPSMQYADIEKLMGVGQYQQAQSQAQIDADKARFDAGQNRGLTNLQQLNQLLQGASAYSGSTTTGNTSLNRNPFAGAVGGAAAGGMLGGAMAGSAGGPWGMAAGALLGGLFG